MAASFVLVCSIPGAEGTDTKVWEIGSAEELAQGTFEGTKLTMTGELVMGSATLRADLPGASAVWSVLTVGQDVWLGTGNEGSLWLMRGDRLVEAVSTKSVILPCLATDGQGTVFAGSVPDGAIYRFEGKTLEDSAKKALAGPQKLEWVPGHGKHKPDPKAEAKDKKDSTPGDKGQEPEKGKTGPDPKAPPGPGADPGAAGAPGDKGKSDSGPEPWVKLDEADHVWALAWDGARKILYAGTGPSGIVYAIDSAGRASVLADTDEEHILSLAVAPDGAVLAGTANGALLLRIEGPGRLETLWDFEGSEVRSIVTLPPADTGGKDRIAVAVNTFRNTPAFSPKLPSLKDMAEPKKASQGDTFRPPEGQGLVALLTPGIGYRELWQDKTTYLTSMAAGKDTLRVATGTGGRVMEIDLEGRSSVLFDVDERQVLAFDLEAKQPVLATADSASVHRVLAGAPSDPWYVSKVFDAGFPARWGRLVLRAEAPVSWQSRSGNTKEPDPTWSDWTKPVAALEGMIASPPARYLQVRLRIEGTGRAWNCQSFFLPFNQKATVMEVNVGSSSDKAAQVKPAGQPPQAKGKGGSDPMIQISWKVDNPDSDAMRYVLWFSAEGQEQWIPILEKGTWTTKTEHQWDTTTVPAGWYVIKVVSTDAEVNDPALSIEDSQLSRSVLVDNDPPEISLSVKPGKGSAVFSGSITDAFSEISKIEISIDGGPFQVLFSEDLILDQKKESYSHEMKGLEPGPHTVIVRGADRRGNGTSAGASFVVK